MPTGTVTNILNDAKGKRIIILDNNSHLRFFESNDEEYNLRGKQENDALYASFKIGDTVEYERNANIISIVRNVSAGTIDYKKMLKNVPQDLWPRTKGMIPFAYVKYTNGANVEVYSPIFKDITIHTNGDTMGCQRGDEIEMKLSDDGRSFSLVRNITLNSEINRYVQHAFGMDGQPLKAFKTWRDEYLKNQKQH